MTRWKRHGTAAVLAAALTSMTGCTAYQTQGGAAGGAMGGIAGALLDSRNPWRGGVIGATLGALAGATISEVSAQGAREAANAGRPVEYRTERGPYVYRADPVPAPPSASTRCRKVRERVYEGDRLVRDHVKEVCEGEKFERGY
jgi:glycine zipper 2TM protein